MAKSISRVDYTRRFDKQLRRASFPIQRAFHTRYKLFLTDPFHPFLHNHQLTGSYEGCRSINITGDWRAVYREITDSVGNTIIIFVEAGTHSQLYR